MASNSEPIRENNPAPDANAESKSQTNQANPDILVAPSVSTPPPTKTHCQIACKVEKDSWDKFKTAAEILGIGLLAIYTMYTIKMYDANKESADATQESAAAADNAARIAGNALVTSQKNFQIDQRPWVIAESPPIFVQAPAIEKITSANITKKNIGRTPAVKEVDFCNLLRFHPSNLSAGLAGRKRFADFINSAYADLRKQAAAREKEPLTKEFARVDYAPGAEPFSTSNDSTPMSSQDIVDLGTGTLTLYYVGIIFYTDSFDAPYETEFCYYYFGTGVVPWGETNS